MLIPSKFYPTLLYIVFVFFLAFLFAFFISSVFKKKKKKKRSYNEGSNQLPSVYLSAASCSGSTMCALGTMLPSVVGVSTHTRHTLVGTNYVHVACSVYGKIFSICGSFGYRT